MNVPYNKRAEKKNSPEEPDWHVYSNCLGIGDSIVDARKIAALCPEIWI